MFKKFFKKIGKGIKKVSKGITKGLKSLFKSKVGKIIGTVALMFIAPYLLSSAGSFFTGSLGTSVATTGEALATAATTTAGTTAGTAASTAASTKALTVGQKMVKAFTNVGKKMQTAYNTVTEGITNFFTGGTGTTTGTSVTDSVASGVEKTLGETIDVTKTLKKPAVELKLPIEEVAPTLEKTALETTKGRIGVAGEETASGKLITGEIGETVKIAESTPSLLDKDLLLPDKIGVTEQLAKDTSIQFKDRLAQAYQSVTKDPTTGLPADSFSEAYRNIKKIKPFSKLEKLPKIVKGTSVAEIKMLSDRIAVNRMAAPYQQPQVDVTQAQASLAEVDLTGSGANQLPSSMPLDISGAPKPMDAAAWLAMVNKHGYLYSASKFGQTA